jgi:hypothetical protein
MLSMITTATADTTASVDAALVQRPSAGLGAGAFVREVTFIPEGSLRPEGTGSKTAGVACLVGTTAPVASAAGVSGTAGYVQAGSASRAVRTSLGQASGTGVTQHFNQMTRIPVIPGGVGPHPAREPDPV